MVGMQQSLVTFAQRAFFIARFCKLGVFLRGLNVVKVSSPLQVSAAISANYTLSCLINVTHRLSLRKLPGAVAFQPAAASCS